MLKNPSHPYAALTIAKWFVAWAAINEADLPNLKLQKLLYYAQGYHLGRFGEPLFRDKIEAWAHGPVVEAVYHEFKKAGSSDLVLARDDDFDWSSVDERTTQLLVEIWDKFGGLAAWRLRDMSHSEAPWKEHFEEGIRHVEIPLAALSRFFRSQTQTGLTVDQAFAEMANDAAYREEAVALTESFALSDWEALGVGERRP